MLDCPQPGHGELLRGLVGAAKVGVIGLHYDRTATVGYRVMHDTVVGHLKADDIADCYGPEPQNPRPVSCHLVIGNERESLDELGQYRAHRHILTKRHWVTLDVRRACASSRRPNDAAVLQVLPVVGVGHRPDERGHAHVADRRIDQRVGTRVPVRINVTGVLREDDQVRAGYSARPDKGGQPVHGGDVIVQDGCPLAKEAEPKPWHIALHDRRRDRAPIGLRQRDGRPDRGEPDDRGSDREPQRGCGHPARPRADGKRGEQATGQRDGEGQQWCTAYSGIPGERRGGLAECEPSPGEPADWKPCTDGFFGHPQACCPQRSAAKPHDRGDGRAKRREVEGLNQAKHEARVWANHVQPEEQHPEEDGAEDEAEEGTAAQWPPRRLPDRDRDQGDGGWCGRPPGCWWKCQGQ